MTHHTWEQQKKMFTEQFLKLTPEQLLPNLVLKHTSYKIVICKFLSLWRTFTSYCVQQPEPGDPISNILFSNLSSK